MSLFEKMVSKTALDGFAKLTPEAQAQFLAEVERRVTHREFLFLHAFLTGKDAEAKPKVTP